MHEKHSQDHHFLTNPAKSTSIPLEARYLEKIFDYRHMIYNKLTSTDNINQSEHSRNTNSFNTGGQTKNKRI
jgi:hypothetical protein